MTTMIEKRLYKDIAQLPIFVTFKEFGKICRVTPKTVRQWANQGRIKTLKLTAGAGSGRRLIPKAELQRFLEESIS